MTDTCTCSPDDCHGGHTINVGPSWVNLPDERLRQLRDDPGVCTNAGERSMAAELLALRASVTELETKYGERVADGFGIQQLGAEDNAAALTVAPTTEEARHLVLAMSMACGQMLDDAEAPNYVEFEVSPAGHTGHGAYVVHVRRAGGPSPHTLRRDAEARAEKAEARVTELEAERDHYCAETERLHQVAAAECDTIADYLDELAALADGPLASNLATAYRSAALAVRGRATRHRDPGVADPPQSNAAAEREATQRAARCQVTTVDPSRPDRPSCAWCVLPAGHQGMHRAELPQDHSAPATLEWPSEVTDHG